MGAKKVSVIGAGLGGLSAAISLANKGFDVQIFEKNSHAGGKLNQIEKEGFRFDMGPSILTLPHYFRRLFEMSDKNMDDYVKFVPVRPHWRNFFEDGVHIDLHPDLDIMKKECEKLPGDAQKNFDEIQAFLNYSKDQYRHTEAGYLEQGLDNVWDFLKFYSFKTLMFKIDHKNNMSDSVKKYISDPKMQAIFEYFIKYVGSSAKNAPGFMNLMPNIQYEFDLWYVEGGMFKLAKALEKLALELGIEFEFNTRIVNIEKQGKNLTQLQTEDGKTFDSDIFVSNMEAIPLYEHVLNEPTKDIQKLNQKFEASCSGLVVHLGLKKIYPQLAHHNFFFSKNQDDHFDAVFDRHELSMDPTIYLVAPSRTDQSVAPQGCDNLKILPHIPHISDRRPLTEDDYRDYRKLLLNKLERMGLADIEKNIIVEETWNPNDIKEQYLSNKGSIYGVVTDWKKNQAFKVGQRSAKYKNLFFVGGSTNPGAGMPMVVLSGQNAAQKISKYYQA